MPRTVNGLRAKEIVLEHLNATSTFGVYASNPRFTREYIMAEIVASDYDFANAIAMNPDHPERAMYALAPVAIAQGAQLPASVGEHNVVTITRSDGKIVKGKTATPNWIDIWRNDTSNIFGGPEMKEGYYCTLNGEFRFTGQSATIVTYDVTLGSWSGAAGSETFTLRSPEQLTFHIAYYTLGKLYMKQQDMVQAAQFYMSLAAEAFKAISEGGLPIPVVEQYQQQRG